MDGRSSTGRRCGPLPTRRSNTRRCRYCHVVVRRGTFTAHLGTCPSANFPTKCPACEAPVVRRMLTLHVLDHVSWRTRS